MAYEKKKKKQRPVKVLLLLAVLIPLVLTVVASTIGRKDLTLPHRLSLEVLGSVQYSIVRTLDFFENIWDHYLNLVNVSKENERLKAEVKKQMALNAEYREAAATNARLTKLLELERTFDAPMLTAQIIGRDPSLWFKTLTVSKGSSAGITKGMPVLTLEGVVGQVSNVSPHYAKILLATDPNSAIDAIVQKNRTQGLIKGDGKNFLLHYVLKNSVINKKDHIITSGMGGIFPKGLPVGIVSEVIKSRRGMFQKIKVKPAVDFHSLEYVTIILKTDALAE